MLQWLLSIVAVYEPDEWEGAGCCSGCCQILQCISQMSGRWLVVAVVVVGGCSGCCRLLQCISRMSGRWLVVAVVVDGCCSVLPR